MKHLQALVILFGITMIGEFLSQALPLPVPAGVYGLFLLLLFLCTGLVKLPQIETVGTFLLDTMPLMFIPATVKLLETYGEIRPILLPLTAILILTTIAVMAVTGKTAQKMLAHDQQEVQP